MKNINTVSLGERLSELLEEQALTTSLFAKEIGVSFSIVSEWSRGKSAIKLSNLLKISKFFNCSVDFLCGRTETFGSFSSSKHTFPARLLQLIKNSDKNKTQIFSLVGLNRHALYDWKKGVEPLSTNLIAFADYFDCTVDFLIGIDD